MDRKKPALLLALLLLFTLLTGCGADKGEASVQSVAMICGIGNVGVVTRFAGMVTPQGEIQIKASENAAVDEILVKVGDTVTAGQALFTYDMEQAQLELEKAQLELEKLKNSLASLEEQKKDTENLLLTSDPDTQREYTLDIRQFDADILQAKYDISTKEKEIEKLTTTVNSVTVTSPVDGVVQTINESGSTDDMGNPKPLMTVVETGGYRIKGYVNESNAYSLTEGMSVLLRSRISDQIWRGTVTEVDWDSPVQGGSNMYGYTDSDTAQSSKYPFYVALEDCEGLLLGQHLYIEPDYGQGADEEDNAIRLPSYYICDVDSAPYVWAQDSNGKLEKRSVSLAEYDLELDTYAITEGLSADDYIAFPDETLCVGMACTTYDESNFSGDDVMGYEETVYEDNSASDDAEGNVMPVTPEAEENSSASTSEEKL